MTCDRCGKEIEKGQKIKLCDDCDAWLEAEEYDNDELIENDNRDRAADMNSANKEGF